MSFTFLFALALAPDVEDAGVCDGGGGGGGGGTGGGGIGGSEKSPGAFTAGGAGMSASNGKVESAGKFMSRMKVSVVKSLCWPTTLSLSWLSDR